MVTVLMVREETFDTFRQKTALKTQG